VCVQLCGFDDKRAFRLSDRAALPASPELTLPASDRAGGERESVQRERGRPPHQGIVDDTMLSHSTHAHAHTHTREESEPSEPSE